MNTASDHLFNVMLIGDTKVGKSGIFARTHHEANYKWGSAYKPTIGVEFNIVYQSLEDKNIRLHMWDISGHGRFNNVSRSYYRGAHGFLIVYDITNRESFEHLTKWIEGARGVVEKETEFVLLGNCCDIEEDRQVSYEEGREFAKTYGFPFFEVSARTMENIKFAVKTMAGNLVSTRMKQLSEESNNDQNKISLQRESKLKNDECIGKCNIF